MSTVYQWINKEKSRYYTITIHKESNSQIILNHCWGGITSNRGGKKKILVQSEEVQTFIDNMMKRRKRRGYEMIFP